LSVSEGDDDRVLIHCHAGCATDAVLGAIGLAATDLFPAKDNKMQITDTYTYTDDDGTLLYQVVRLAPKGFRQRRPDGAGGWTWNMDGTPRVLFRLPQVRAAVTAGETIYVVEGEKDVHAAETVGVIATTNPGGAGKWQREFTETLAHTNVVLVADADEPGRHHALAVADELRSEGATVEVREPLAGKDLSDHLAEGYTITDLIPVRETSDGDDQASDDGDDQDTSRRRVSQADELVSLANSAFTMGYSTDGEPFAVAADRPGVALLLRGGRESFRRDLAAAYYRDKSKVPSSAALADALVVLESIAGNADPSPVFLRVGWRDGDIVLDLARPDGQVVVISSTGWAVVEESPVLFRHTVLTSPLPLPLEGVGLDGLDDLWAVTNIAPESRAHVLAWLVSNLLNAAHPILALLGIQGTGKSTTARYVASLSDPSPAPLRAMPRDLEGWGVAASGSYVVPLDNVSSLTEWFADVLCRSATGEGILRRRLYTDSELSVLTFLRPVILTSIDTGAMRGDLGDRLVVVDTVAIQERRTDHELAAAWEAGHPRVLGALLDLTARVLSIIDTVEVDVLPRMADYGRVLAAVDKIMGSNGFEGYRDQAGRVAEEVVEADDVALGIRALGTFEGTMAELLEELNGRLGDRRSPKGWPATPRGLRSRLNRALPALARVGTTVTIERQRDGSNVQISPTGDGCNGHNSHTGADR